MKKKILIISLGNGLSTNIGGSLSRLLNTVRFYQEDNKKFQFHFLLSSGTYEIFKKYEIKGEFYKTKSFLFNNLEKNNFDRLKSYFVDLFHSFTFINKVKPDIVYTDSDYFVDVIPSVIFKIFHRALWVQFIHHKLNLNFNKKFFFVSLLSILQQKILWTLINIFSNKIFLYKTPEGKKISNLISSRKKLFYFTSNGFNENYLLNSKIEKKFEKFDILLVGGLRPNKGLYDIIPFTLELKKTHTKIKILLIGGSNYEEFIRNQIKVNKLEKNIILLGNQDNIRVFNFYKTVNLYLSLSYEEGWCSAICEALISNCYVLAYNLPSLNYNFHKNIFFSHPGDYRLLAKKASELIFLKKKNKSFVNKKDNTYLKKFNWKIVANNDFKEIFNLKR